MFTVNVYKHLEKIGASVDLTEDHFYALIVYFRESISEEINFRDQLVRHRKPAEYLTGVLRHLYDYHAQMQRRPEMLHTDESGLDYVPSRIQLLWDEDRHLRSLYYATRQYCQIYAKSFPIVAVHIAEYRAVNKLITILRRMVNRRNGFSYDSVL
jgi:hypothetical protein